MLLWLSSVSWARTLDIPMWDILATDVAVYFDSELRKLELQTYQSISPTKVREKPLDNAENRENGVWREGKLPSLVEKAAQTRRWTTFSNIYVPDDRKSRSQVLGIVTSQAT